MAAMAAMFSMGFTACSNNDDEMGGSPVENGKKLAPMAFNTSLDSG